MKILSKKILTTDGATRVVEMDVAAPHVARKALPGQFVVVMVREEAERIPLTIVRAENDAVTLIFQEAGFSTRLLGACEVGDELFAIAGPMGHATDISELGAVIIVGGGVGIAEIYPVAAAFKKAGNAVITILGARTKDLLILEDELRDVSDELFVATDDGSHGQKGFTTDVLKEILENKSNACDVRPVTCCLVYAVGPIPMMKNVAAVTASANVSTLVSLNALMLDATGMCGVCRVTVGGEVKFACVDGPEFDAHKVDWDELTKRNAMYVDKEKHICRLSDL